MTYTDEVRVFCIKTRLAGATVVATQALCLELHGVSPSSTAMRNWVVAELGIVSDGSRSSWARSKEVTTKRFNSLIGLMKPTEQRA